MRPPVGRRAMLTGLTIYVWICYMSTILYNYAEASVLAVQGAIFLLFYFFLNTYILRVDGCVGGLFRIVVVFVCEQRLKLTKGLCAYSSCRSEDIFIETSSRRRL